MTTHHITEGDLHAFIDNELDEESRAAVTHYLAEHPEAAERVAIYRKQRDELRDALGPMAEEPLPPQLDLAAIIESHHNTPRRGKLYGLAAAVLLAMASAAGGWFLRGFDNGPSAGIMALTQEAADSYEVFAPDRVRPVEVREQPEMVKWASKRLNRAVAAPDLTDVGYRFMGGRLISTPHGPAVLFMYDDDHGTRIVLLSRRMLVEQNANMAHHSRGGVTGIAWAEKGIGYSVVGHVSTEQLERIAGEAHRQLTQSA
jgi:anti-sigma factor RsiW